MARPVAGGFPTKEVQTQTVAALRAQGLSQEQVGVELGLSTRTVRRIEARPEYPDAMRVAVRSSIGEVGTELAMQLRRALCTTVELLDSADDRVRLRAAQTILTEAPQWIDRLGLLDEVRTSATAEWLDKLEDATDEQLDGMIDEHVRH